MSVLAELTALEQRALLAFVDRKASVEDHLIRVAEEIARDILGADEIVVTAVNLNARCVFFEVDGLPFKAEARITTNTSSGSNLMIDGIHDEEKRYLHFHKGETFHPITELCDLGRLLAPLASAPAPANYGLQGRR